MIVRGDGVLPEIPDGEFTDPWKASSRVARPMFFLYTGEIVAVVTNLSNMLAAFARALEIY